MSEEIIIDGVNVAECAYSLIYEQEISCISRLQDVASFNRNPNVAKLNVCKNNPNCYYKQLKQLEKEHAELIAKFNSISLGFGEANEKINELETILKMIG